MQLTVSAEFPELAPELSFDIPKDKVQKPEYGRLLDDFNEGDVYIHPRAFTINRSFAQEFATTFHESCPLFLAAPYAQAHGFKDLLVSPLQVFNIVLSLGVQNNSEKAVANLGYYNVRFLRPVYPGDTLRALTRILSKRVRGEDKPGIVHVQSVGLDQNDAVVLQYERKIMIAPGKTEYGQHKTKAPTRFPENTTQIELPTLQTKLPMNQICATRPETGAQNLKPGMVIVHKNMRTITDEHVPWTYRMGNTHPLHYDRIYSQGLAGKMSGEPIVYGGLIFAWLAGLASRDTTENMLWDLGYSEGYHTQPAIAGDTVGAISRVLQVTDASLAETSIVQIQLIGIKNMPPAAALDEYGADLFIKENDKKKLDKSKIAAKIFEIERQVLLKK